MTENQKLLARYLLAIGCPESVAFKITCNVWEELATIEMLQYCKENPKATEAELLEMSLKISSKYPTEDECDDEE